MSEYRDFVPLGMSTLPNHNWAADWRDGSYLIWTQNVTLQVCAAKGLGLPASIGAFTGDGPFFCPSAMINFPQEGFKQSTAGNQNRVWPSTEGVPWIRILSEKCHNSNGTILKNGQGAYATYSVRAAIPEDQTGWRTFPIYNLYPQDNTDEARYYNPESKLPPGYVTIPNMGLPLPKQHQLRTNMVIASDFVCGGPYLDITHKGGVNALRLDGSASWVPRGVIEPYLSTKAVYWQGKPPWSRADYDGTAGNDGNPNAHFQKLWNAMDRN